MCSSSENEAPALKDRYYMCYIVVYSMGIISLLPTNFFTTSTDYWMYKFRDPSTENYDGKNKTTLQTQFVADFAIVANVGFVVFVFLTARFGHLVSAKGLITGTLITTTSILALTAIFSQVNTDTWQTGFFVLTMIKGFILTGSSCIFMTTVFRLIAKFPPSYSAALLSGQSMCGIFSALVQLLAISVGARPQIAGLLFFLIGMAFTISCLTIFIVMLKKSEFFQYYVYLDIERESAKPKIPKEVFLGALYKTKFYVLALFMVTIGTGIQPGLTSLYDAPNKYFIPGVTFLLYSVCDYAGKETVRKLQTPKNQYAMLALTACRLALIPLLMFCNLHPRPNDTPIVFDQDWQYIIFLILLGFTNGYFINLCVIQVASKFDTPLEKKLGQFIILVFLIVSFAISSFVGAALVNAL